MSAQGTDGYSADNDYAKTSGEDPIPVQKDEAPIETGVQDPTDFEGGENSDEQLAKDDKDAIDPSNIIESRTRGSTADGSMRDPGDDEGLPTDDGTSSTS